MNKFDLTPFTRGTIGFDRIFELVDRQIANTTSTYPPYNIIKTDENRFEIEVALAGFTMEELSVTQDKDQLVIQGNKLEVDNQPEYLHKGLATRNFTRTFTLADHVDVVSAKLENGILTVQLERNIPESLQPRKVAIDYISK